MSSIQSALESINKSTPPTVNLVAVSKTKPVSDIQIAYDSGQREFGENKAQELVEKVSQLPNDIKWHFIGHLQSKKVKLLIEHTHLIHSVDSEKLLREINKRAKSIGKVQKILLQIHIAQEEHKHGLSEEEGVDLIGIAMQELDFIEIAGLMGMATFTENQTQIDSEFRFLKELFDKYKMNYFSNHPSFKEISMGMSGDFMLGVKHGSTIIRVGSLIFGGRNYG